MFADSCTLPYAIISYLVNDTDRGIRAREGVKHNPLSMYEAVGKHLLFMIRNVRPVVLLEMTDVNN